MKKGPPSENRRALERAVTLARELVDRQRNAAHRVRQRIIRHLNEGASTQKELADRLGKTPPGLHRILSGIVDPRLKDLDLIADALGRTPEELVAPLEGEEGSGMWTASERQVLDRLQRSEDRELVFKVLRTLVFEREERSTKKRGA